MDAWFLEDYLDIGIVFVLLPLSEIFTLCYNICFWQKQDTFHFFESIFRWWKCSDTELSMIFNYFYWNSHLLKSCTQIVGVQVYFFATAPAHEWFSLMLLTGIFRSKN